MKPICSNGVAVLCCLAAVCFATSLRAEETPAPLPPSLNFNLKLPTFGGKQFWTDELVHHGWRIQRHAITGHYRLLDDQNDRRAWGDFAACKTRFERLKRELDLPPLKGRVVIALHGIVRSRSSMKPVCKCLEQDAGYTVLNVSYASTRESLDDHARALARVIENLGPEVTEINFVAHSLGNLLIRRYLAASYGGEGGLEPDPRIGRIVMLTPPNRGARLAEMFKNNVILEWVWGESAIQLAERWDDLEQRLATPRCEFAILAGELKSPEGGNLLLRGEDDFVVTVEETRLPGARDFRVLPVFHSAIMRDETAQQFMLRFIKEGYFESEAERQPIPADGVGARSETPSP